MATMEFTNRDRLLISFWLIGQLKNRRGNPPVLKFRLTREAHCSVKRISIMELSRLSVDAPLVGAAALRDAYNVAEA